MTQLPEQPAPLDSDPADAEHEADAWAGASGVHRRAGPTSPALPVGAGAGPAQPIAAEQPASGSVPGQTQLRALAEAIPEIVWTADATGDLDYVNGRWGAYTGHDVREPIGSGWTAFLHPDDRGATEAEWHRSVQGGEPFEITHRLRGADGRYRWFLTRGVPVRGADGGALRWFGTATDVDAQTHAAELERTARLAADRAREHLARVFGQAPVALTTLRGPEHVFETINPLYQQIVGDRDVIGKPVRDALPELEGQPFFDLLNRVYTTGDPYVGTEVPARIARRPGGPPEEVFFNFVYQPLVDAAGAVYGIAAVAVDVTEFVQARERAQQLRLTAERAQAGAEAANEAKSQFLATMSHEIRTPINAIQGYAQLLELGVAGPVTSQQRDYLGRLATSSEHLLGLVNDVLDLSKIEAGEMVVSREDTMTGAALAAALDLTRPQAEAQGVRLIDEHPGDPGVPYVGDEHRVRQILVNLLSNAIKFTEPGGTVTISCAAVSAAPSRARLHGPGPRASVRVSDTGIGIPPEEHAAVFEPFHQAAHGETGVYTRTRGGTGLGLAISRRLARLMAGDVTLESTPGVGSVFTLWLPAGELAPAEESAGDAVSAGSAGGAWGTRRRDDPALRFPALGRLGDLVREQLDVVLTAYAARLRTDPATPRASYLRGPQLEDHQLSLLADLGQSLAIVAGAGAEAAEMLRDGSVIQRAVAERHGTRRFAQGWTAEAVRRDHQILREELERVVRARVPADAGDVTDALGVLSSLIERAETISLRAWRRAAQAQEQARGGTADRAPGFAPDPVADADARPAAADHPRNAPPRGP